MVIGKFIITPLGDGLLSIMIFGNDNVKICAVEEIEEVLQQIFDKI